MTASNTQKAASAADTRPVLLRHRLEYALYVTIQMMARMVGDPGLRVFGSFVGWVASWAVKRRTSLADRNLQLVYPDMPDSERARIVRECWKHYATETTRYIRDSGLSTERVSEKFDLVNPEYCEEALSRGKGALVLSAHFGAWEAALMKLNAFGHKVAVVGRRLDNPILHRKLVEGRGRTGFELLDRRAAARDLIRSIQEDAIMVLLIDQAVQPREGVLVPFLGKDAWTTSAAARLARKYDCPILMIFTYPPGDGERGRAEFEPVIEIGELTDAEIMTKVNARIAARVDKDPHLWLWFHDRWKGVEERGA